MPKASKELMDLIKEAKSQLRIKQATLARAIGLPVSTMGLIATGKGQHSEERLKDVEQKIRDLMAQAETAGASWWQGNGGKGEKCGEGANDRTNRTDQANQGQGEQGIASGAQDAGGEFPENADRSAGSAPLDAAIEMTIGDAPGDNEAEKPWERVHVQAAQIAQSFETMQQTLGDMIGNPLFVKTRLILDFSGHEDLFAMLKEAALRDFRSAEQQALYFINACLKEKMQMKKTDTGAGLYEQMLTDTLNKAGREIILRDGSRGEA